MVAEIIINTVLLTLGIIILSHTYQLDFAVEKIVWSAIATAILGIFVWRVTRRN